MIAGVHRFKFLPSEKTKGHTTFVQEENFEGALGFLLADNWYGHKIGKADMVIRNYEKFNEDFAKSFGK